MQLCASRGCGREKSPIPPHPILPTLCHRAFRNGWRMNVQKSTTLAGNPRLDLSEIGQEHSERCCLGLYCESSRSRVAFPPGFSFLQWEPPAWLCCSLCSFLGAAQAFWAPVLFPSSWPNWSSPAFMSSLTCPSQLLFCSPSSYPLWHTPHPTCSFLRVLLSVAWKKHSSVGSTAASLAPGSCP